MTDTVRDLRGVANATPEPSINTLVAAADVQVSRTGHVKSRRCGTTAVVPRRVDWTEGAR